MNNLGPEIKNDYDKLGNFDWLAKAASKFIIIEAIINLNIDNDRKIGAIKKVIEEI